MAYQVLIPQDVAQPGKDYLRERGYEIKMGSGITAEAIMADVVECDAILARTAPFPAKVLEAGKKLKVISRHGVGYDNIDVARATELGIWVTFAPEALSNTVVNNSGLYHRPCPELHLLRQECWCTGNWEIRRDDRDRSQLKDIGRCGFGVESVAVAEGAHWICRSLAMILSWP
ncbi:MAG: hypothetical protein L7F78_12225 [Syntrophales bacterium LBB04]|nr:hypothetical protein [Syntrophales bacterium LBB04]